MAEPQTVSNPFDEKGLVDFLGSHGWDITKTLAKDSSIRRYYRAEKDGRSAILMESVPDDHPLMSRGHRLVDFIRLARWLNDNGLSAPKIYEVDEVRGYMILEDFGDVSLKHALTQGADPRILYEAANEVLRQIASIDEIPALPNYYESRVHESRDCILKFYIPEGVRGRAELSAAYFDAWAEIEKGLPPHPQGFVHVDFHAENLMWREGEKGLARIGILDFQGAMHGPRGYDLGNLLEDARVNVPRDIQNSILSGYDEDFRAHYRVLTTQFHCRVIGQFIKIAEETGNTGYLKHIPRLEAYIRDALQDPLLAPLKSFFDNLPLDF